MPLALPCPPFVTVLMSPALSRDSARYIQLSQPQARGTPDRAAREKLRASVHVPLWSRRRVVHLGSAASPRRLSGVVGDHLAPVPSGQAPWEPPCLTGCRLLSSVASGKARFTHSGAGWPASPTVTAYHAMLSEGRLLAAEVEAPFRWTRWSRRPPSPGGRRPECSFASLTMTCPADRAH